MEVNCTWPPVRFAPPVFLALIIDNDLLMYVLMKTQQDLAKESYYARINSNAENDRRLVEEAR
jgi:hypothetical protein